MTAAVARVGEIDRGQCRAAAERRFSLARMAADYERLYRVIPTRLSAAPAHGPGRCVTYGPAGSTRHCQG